MEESDNQSLTHAWQAFALDHLLVSQPHPHPHLPAFRHFSDVCVCVGGSSDGGSAFFHLHRFVLEQRSDYFKALFASPLKGGQRLSAPAVGGDVDSNGNGNGAAPVVLTVTMQDTRRQVFAAAVSFMYSNTAPDLYDSTDKSSGISGSADNNDDDARMEEAVSRALAVLDLAERLVLSGLKTLAGAVLRKILHCRAGDDPYPAATVGGAAYVFEVLEASRTFALPALEDSCYEVIAGHLMDITDAPESTARLLEFIVEDASSVKGRQAEDSIPIIDELCTQIKKLWSRRADREVRVERLRELAASKGYSLYYVEDGDEDDEEDYEEEG